MLHLFLKNILQWPETANNSVMHAKPDLRVFLKWMIAGSGSVITDVILLNPNASNENVSQSPPLGLLIMINQNAQESETRFLTKPLVVWFSIGLMYGLGIGMRFGSMFIQGGAQQHNLPATLGITLVVFAAGLTVTVAKRHHITKKSIGIK